MIRVTLEIDNHTAHSCSPLKFLEKFVLLDATETEASKYHARLQGEFDTPYAKILVTKLEQE